MLDNTLTPTPLPQGEGLDTLTCLNPDFFLPLYPKGLAA